MPPTTQGKRSPVIFHGVRGDLGFTFWTVPFGTCRESVSVLILAGFEDLIGRTSRGILFSVSVLHFSGRGIFESARLAVAAVHS